MEKDRAASSSETTSQTSQTSQASRPSQSSATSEPSRACGAASASGSGGGSGSVERGSAGSGGELSSQGAPGPGSGASGAVVSAGTRRALVSDAPAIHRLIGVCSELGFMLPKTLGQIYETMQEWVVAVEGERVIGCAALHVDYALLAEIRSVAVDPGLQRKGVGRLLVEAQVEEARKLGVRNVFVLTDKPEYFRKLGFHEIDMADLPRKIWRDCVNCPVFPECRETALLRATDPGAEPLY